MTSAKKRFFVLAAVFASFFVYLAAAVVFGKISAYRSVTNVCAFVSSFCVLKVMMKRFPEDTEGEIVTDGEEKTTPTVGKAKLFGGIALSVALMLGVNFALSFILKSATVTDKSDILLRTIAGVFFYPAMEEYLFRHGYLKALLKGGCTEYVSIPLTAILFSSVHSGVGVPIAFACGIILGTLYVKVQGKHAISAVYLAHALYNGVLYLTLALS